MEADEFDDNPSILAPMQIFAPSRSQECRVVSGCNWPSIAISRFRVIQVCSRNRGHMQRMIIELIVPLEDKHFRLQFITAPGVSENIVWRQIWRPNLGLKPAEDLLSSGHR